jgi:hypothetical protein
MWHNLLISCDFVFIYASSGAKKAARVLDGHLARPESKPEQGLFNGWFGRS